MKLLLEDFQSFLAALTEENHDNPMIPKLTRFAQADEYGQEQAQLVTLKLLLIDLHKRAQ